MSSQRQYRRYAVRVIIVYGAVMLGWILLSAPLMDQFVHHPVMVNVYRALFFLFSAAVLLFTLLRQQKLLMRSREEYHHLFSTLREPMLMHWDGIILDVNEYFVALLEATDRKELIGKSVFDFIHPDFRAAVEDRIRNLHGGESTPPYEQQWLTVSGERRHVEVAAVKTTFRGKPAVLAIAHDATERKAAEELMLKSEKLAMVGQLAAGIAHEIKNPLSSLKGFVQLIDEGVTDRLGYYCRVMLDEVQRMELIVSEFLVLSKSPIMQMTSVNITQLVEETMALLLPEANMRNIEMAFTLEPDIPPLMCDQNRMKQVLVNLLKNALEAVTTRGQVVVRVERDANRVRISVKDTGVGIAKSDLHKIGEPFFTTKASGTGLGLMVTSKIIHEHGGEIDFQSTLNEGTEVRVWLPLAGV